MLVMYVCMYVCMYVFSIIVVDDSNKCVSESFCISISFLTPFLLFFSVLFCMGKRGKRRQVRPHF